MNTHVVTHQGFNKQEPIPGYTITELLGVGGFGEVWKAHAPGGLVKAIKFVYGNLNAKRASRELRSLNRIKDVRHPFLLSIERIEVVDGNLLIVTELADQSLKQNCEKYRAKGLPGIPREELLAFLRDTAEALDYIYENFSLQHLDVKPENLLLVGNRAKVADFGLVKNLYERSASLIDGLTPIYSPPELFEGRPNRHSDQYSLAIVYQEMLSGELPFDGLTAAHLASQHLHAPPVLSGLPKSDRPVIARALSKDPVERFPSCRALIDGLVEAGKGLSEASNFDVADRGVRIIPSGTLFNTEQLTDGMAETTPVLPADTSSRHPAQLPVDDIDGSDAEYRPVLIVGVGGIATRVMRRLRRRFCDRFGEMHAVPAVEFLLLDTDVKSLCSATEGEPGAALHVSETLAMPLRRIEEYRALGERILASISRRWLYNIPCSLQTEGFRPLGHLAMVDHSSRLLERLRKAVKRITCDESLATTGQNTGLDFRSHHPRVFVVGSISGGTGSGMLLDVAYAARAVLAELNLSDDCVYGILMHATPRGASERDKAIASAYAALSELWHYSRPGSFYPGDRSCGVPPFHGNNRTFSNCYYLHLGDEVNDVQLDEAADLVAEYLFCNAVTPATGFFEKCRRAERAACDAKHSAPVVRTFGLCQLSGANTDIPTIMGELLGQELVHTWRSGIATAAERTVCDLGKTTALITAHDSPKQTRFTRLAETATVKADELKLHLSQMQIEARKVVDQEVSADLESYFRKLIANALETPRADNGQDDCARVLAIVDSVIGSGCGEVEASDETSFESLDVIMNGRLSGCSGKLAATISDWVLGLVDGPDGVDGAKVAAEQFHTHLRKMQVTASKSVARLREQILLVKDSVLAQHKSNLDEEAEHAAKVQVLEYYARLRLEEIILRFVTRVLHLIEGQVITALDQLCGLWNELNELAAEFRVPVSISEFFSGSAEPQAAKSRWRGLLGALVDRRHELVAAADREVRQGIAVGSGKLQSLITKSGNTRNQLTKHLRTILRGLIVEEMKQLTKSRLFDSHEDQNSVEWRELYRWIDAAMPPVCDESSVARLLFMLPDDMTEQYVPAQLSKENYPATTIVCAPGVDLIGCWEVEGLHVNQVAARLVNHRADYIEIARRLHTRINIDWGDMPANDRPKFTPILEA